MQLAIKHRKTKEGDKRIVLFVGSPVKSTPEELKALGTMLYREGVCAAAMQRQCTGAHTCTDSASRFAPTPDPTGSFTQARALWVDYMQIALDVIMMGENEGNVDALTALVNAARKDNNSTLLQVEPGILPLEALMTSPIILGMGDGEGGAAGGVASGAGRFAEYGGFDPNTDPEMALAMQMSLAQAREAEDAVAAAAPSTSADGAPATPAGTGAPATPAASAPAPSGTRTVCACTACPTHRHTHPYHYVVHSFMLLASLCRWHGCGHR